MNLNIEETMNVIQTVEVPANHRLTVDVPHEIPAGKTILIYKPVVETRLPSIKALRGTLHQIDLSNLRDESDRPL